MKYIRSEFKSNKIICRKYARFYQCNMIILIFLKSNYKYKRRSTRNSVGNEKQLERNLRYQQQYQYKNKNQHQKQKQNNKYQLPVVEEVGEVKNMTDDKQTAKRIPFREKTKLDKFLRIFILIVQQVTPTTNNIISSYGNNNTNFYNTNNNSSLATRLVANMKAIKKAGELLTNVNQNVFNRNHCAYKETTKDTDSNLDIGNIGDEINRQKHNYDKVLTITSTPIKYQRRKHHQIKKTSTSTSLSLSLSQSSSLDSVTIVTERTTAMTVSASLSSPSIVAQTNYETCQWSSLLQHYTGYNPSIRHHQYHQKRKCNQHHQHALIATRALNNNKNKSHNNSIYQSVDQYVNTTCSRSYTLSCLLLTLFIAFTIGVRSTAAGACWQTVLGNGKCNEIFSLNITKSECCGANQEFAYTEREPTNVEYFFATAIGGGMECSPCLDSCKSVKCGPHKKCVKRKGRPKCICAPECGATRRKQKHRDSLIQQEKVQPASRHTVHLFNNVATNDNDDGEHDASVADVANPFNIKLKKSPQLRDIRSLNSEIANVNLALDNDKDVMISSDSTSPVEQHHFKEHNQNQRKFMHIHVQHAQMYTQLKQEFQHSSQQLQLEQQQELQQPKHKNEEPKGNRRILITANVAHIEKPTTRRLQILSNVRTMNARRRNAKSNNNDHNNKSSIHGQHEDTDPLDYVTDVNNYSYNDEEDDDGDLKNINDSSKKNSNNNSSNNNNSNGNSNNINSNNSYNNRNDDATKFLNQALSRHKFKANIKPNNYNNNNNNNNNSNNNNNKNRKKHKKNHDLQTNKMQQHSASNSTRARHPQQSRCHAENTLHHHHQNKNHNHYNNHQRQQHHQHNYQQHQNNHPNHGRHKYNNKQHHKQQSIVLKKPKNLKDYISTATSTTTTVTTNTTTAATAIPTSLHLSSPSAPTTTNTTIHIYNTSPKLSLLLTSSTMFSFPSTTPINSKVFAFDNAAADDHYNSRLPNRGSKSATSSSLSVSASAYASSPSTSQSQLSATSAHSPSDSLLGRMSAKGEGVSLRDQRQLLEIPTETTIMHNNNNNNNNINNNNNTNNNKNYNIISASNSELHHIRILQEQKTPLLNGVSEKLSLHGLPNKPQTPTNADGERPINPVCGTDGRTYNTECQLRKRACRTDNQNLHVAYRGHCKTTCNGVKCLNGLTCVEDQYLKPHCIACKIECPQDGYDNDVVDETRAVCGADGKTYKSTCDINRMICEIGRSIGVAYPGPCREEQITCEDINCGPKQVCLIDLLTHKPRCTSCRYKCSRKRRPSSIHFEEGKVCGVNNRTYNSWCALRKDSCSTGFHIDVMYSGDCH